MNDKVFMAPNGNLCVGIPLFRMNEAEQLAHKLEGYFISCHAFKPLAYAVDIGQNTMSFMNAEFFEKHCECLGDL